MIYLEKKQFQEMIEHCQKECPKEACGILAGSRGRSKSFSPVRSSGAIYGTICRMNPTATPVDDEPEGSIPKIVTKVYKMVNTSENPETCYFMEPTEQLKVFKEMRHLRIEMLGIYHSHSQTPAYPSQRDCEMAFYPEASYVIISLKDFNKPEVRAFKIIEGKIEEEKIVVRKNILFVCVENSCRSQMAEAIVNNLYWQKFSAHSAGSKPSGIINSLAIEVMKEIGIDISKQKPKTLTQDMVEESELVITMGCIKGCPLFKGKKIINWDIEDPAGKPLEKFREIRDIIAKKLKKGLNEGK